MSTESSKAAHVSSKSKAKGQGASAKAKAEAKAEAKTEAKTDAKAEAKHKAAARAAEERASEDADDEDGEEGAGELVELALPSWVRRAAAITAIAVGWLFIAYHNHYYVTPAVVMLSLGWAAGVSTLYFLWRTGAAGAADEQGPREDWWKVQSAREELEREKRALLKTIREIEFDQQTGKLSAEDAHEMTQLVRVRAIEVMKELDAVQEEGGGARAEIARELRARLEIEKARKAAMKPMPKPAARPAVKPAKAAASAKPSDDGAKTEAKTEAKAEAEGKAAAKTEAKAKPESSRSETAINAAGAADEPVPLDELAAGPGVAAAADSGAAPGDASDPSHSSDDASQRAGSGAAPAASDDDVASAASSSPSAKGSGKGSEVSA